MLFYGALCVALCFFFFFFNDTATTEIYTLSLHDALPISLLQSFAALAIISIQWVLYGYSIAFGPDHGGLIGGLDWARSEEHTSELQSLRHLVCRLLLEKKKHKTCDVPHRASRRAPARKPS